MSSKLQLTAAVMAGGKSMRMGVDKTLLPMDGEALVARVAGVVGEICANTMVITNSPEAMAEAGLPPGVRVISDEVPYQGPLGGLVTALANARDDWVLAVAADMPHVSTAIVEELWERRGDADIVVPVSEKGPEPLLALYSKRCLPVARQVLDSGRRRLIAIFRELNVAEVPVEALRVVDPELRSFTNVNTPADFDKAAKEKGGGRPIDETDAAARGGGTEASVVSTDAGAPILVIYEGAESRLPIERPITVYLRDVEIATMQATPENLDELAAGFLVAEGFLSRRQQLRGIDFDKAKGLVWVSTSEPISKESGQRKRMITSGCGKGTTFSSLEHAMGLEKIESGMRVSARSIHDLMGDMARGARAYRESGGMHACGLAVGGELRYLREDVGRHNAVDKVLGRAWLDEIDLAEAIMLTTGRISYEMALKAGRAKIPIVVSRTAVTDQAVSLAGALGLTLVGYARGRRMTVHSGAGRIEK